MRYPFARFQNILLAARKENPDPELETCEEVLSYIAEKSVSGHEVRITDLIMLQVFGTGPTVHRKCNLLTERGYLGFEISKTDKRVKILALTKNGHKHLANRSKDMLQAINETAGTLRS